MGNVLLVALGGACGAVLRYLIVSASSLLGVNFPLGTLVVNVAGSLLIGFVASYWGLSGTGSDASRLLFQTGMLGAFTTFSAFSLDSFGLWQSGNFRGAALNIALNVILCLIAVAVGAALGSASALRAG